MNFNFEGADVAEMRALERRIREDRIERRQIENEYERGNNYPTVNITININGNDINNVDEHIIKVLNTNQGKDIVIHYNPMKYRNK